MSDSNQLSAEQALKAAQKVAAAFKGVSELPSYRKAEMLELVSEKIEKESERFAGLICSEVQKPIKEARREVARAVFTFAWAAEEAKRFCGEMLPLDLDKNSEGRLALVRKCPRGPALLISPFNFPLNLAAHKIAPAMAVGAPFVLKPAPQAPRTALELLRVVRESGWPEEAGEVLCCSNEAAEALVKSDFFSTLSFTGSAAVGWRLKALSGKKRVILELGGNAPLWIARGADLDRAAKRAAWGAFYYSGQVCISVQRVLIDEPLYEDFRERFIKSAAALVVGDPEDEKTDVGPLIDLKAAERVERLISETASGGARVILGGGREGRVIPPTVVEGSGGRLNREEAFGPVVAIEKVRSDSEALQKMSEGPYGLQAGIFTNDLALVQRAWRELSFGAVVVNDIPSFRSDAMPYGGAKDSGLGREGARWAMEDYCEPRTLVLCP